MHTVDDVAIARHAAVRFRSDYHYAVFEYWRSAKVLAYLDAAGARDLGCMLDDGCGGGGMCVSFAEEGAFAVGIDPDDRFREAGTRLARERGVTNVRFICADGLRLPFADRAFDTVFSHAVIEHVPDPQVYLDEARRVLAPHGRMFLQTAPHLSPSGAHLPRLRVPVPIHLLLGRRGAFAATRWLARHRPDWLDTPPEGSSFVVKARRGVVPQDDLLYRVTVRNLRRLIARAGLSVIREDLAISRLALRLLPAGPAARIPAIPLVRDVLVTNMEYLLAAR